MAASEYEVVLTKAAEEGLAKLNKGEQTLVVKQLEKLKRAPELGDFLGHKQGLNLTGYRKMYAARKRVRIIYEIENKKLLVHVIAIGEREDSRVYLIAEAEAKKRLRRLG